MSITEFLEARIAEDEALAHAVIATVTPDAWENPTKWGNFYPEDIAFWDSQTPNRVLAECAAKRTVVALADEVDAMDAQITAEWGGPNRGTADDILKALAAVYASNPDYRQEWAL